MAKKAKLYQFKFQTKIQLNSLNYHKKKMRRHQWIYKMRQTKRKNHFGIWILNNMIQLCMIRILILKLCKSGYPYLFCRFFPIVLLVFITAFIVLLYVTVQAKDS